MLANQNKFSDATKNRALELFLKGTSVPSIIKQLKEELDVEIDDQTIYNWSRLGLWSEKRIEARARAIGVLEEAEKDNLDQL